MGFLISRLCDISFLACSVGSSWQLQTVNYNIWSVKLCKGVILTHFEVTMVSNFGHYPMKTFYLHNVIDVMIQATYQGFPVSRHGWQFDRLQCIFVFWRSTFTLSVQTQKLKSHPIWRFIVCSGQQSLATVLQDVCFCDTNFTSACTAFTLFSTVPHFAKKETKSFSFLFWLCLWPKTVAHHHIQPYLLEIITIYW